MIKIGNAQAFWGDSPTAPANLLRLQPDLDYLTLDYLSELSLSIMAVQREKDVLMGYASDFKEVIQSIIPFWKEGSRVKVIANAGGLNPQQCALECSSLLKEAGCLLKIGFVYGDDVLHVLKQHPENPLFNNLDTYQPLSPMIEKLTTANAYLGAQPVVEALRLGADIVITGRIADPSLTVAPCIYHFDWKLDDYNKLAQATIAGHLIECGTQVTGGISTGWLDMKNTCNIGFPVVEMSENGCFVVTKPASTGGQVTLETVKEQLLYEIGDPDSYLSPDATVSFLSLILEEIGTDRIRVIGGLGRAPPPTYKVSASYRDGFKAEGFLVFCGVQACAKARLCGEIVLDKVRQQGFLIERSCIECLGCGDVIPGIIPHEKDHFHECVLKISVAGQHRNMLECFAKEIAPLVTCGPQGTTGYSTGRPRIRPVFGYWPCLIEAAEAVPRIEMIERVL